VLGTEKGRQGGGISSGKANDERERKKISLSPRSLQRPIKKRVGRDTKGY